MTRLVFLCAVVGLAWPTAHADDRALANLIAAMKNHTGSRPAPVSVSAVAAVDGREIVLRFSLKNISTKTLTLYPYEVPWGDPYAIRWAALTGDGRVLPVGYPFDDRFGPESKIGLAPGQTLTGNYRLSWMLDAASVPTDTDLAIVWLYSFPPGPLLGKNERPICTGIAYVHTP
jgi:hypothetical protein